MRYRTTTINDLYPDPKDMDNEHELFVYSTTNNPDGASAGTDAKSMGVANGYTHAADLWEAAEAAAKAIYGPDGDREIGLCVASPLTFREAMAELKDKVCEPCSGSGELNDADPGDISFNTWRCTICKGTGFAPGA